MVVAGSDWYWNQNTSHCYDRDGSEQQDTQKRGFTVRIFGFLALVLMLAACASAPAADDAWAPPVMPPTVDPADPVMVEARRNYDSFCAHCHGYAGDGQGAASEERTLALGYKIVPRHDSQGHTWQHPDPILFQTIKYGVESPLNLYPMTEYGSRLTDEQIFGIVDYMKRFWTDEQREHQADLTRRYEENQPEWELNHLDIYQETETPE